MPTFETNGRTYEVDEDGFLDDPQIWNNEVAIDFASTEGVDQLTEEHWKVINYIRNYYENYAIAPMIRKLCKATGFTLEQIYVLFPLGHAKGACKVAGLAQPAGCV
jgi:TusE/DsrC/DsvC family sulfur relay protein